jgi:Putative phage metallopeptidase
MPTSYRECPDEVADRAKRLRQQYHLELIEADVTICLLFASNPDGTAIMHNGWPAQALCRKNNLRDRVAGLADATIVIDEDLWADLSEPRRLALLDHELHHLTVARNKVGGIKYDDANRPKLSIRPHDYQMGGFHELVRRHAAASAESVAYVDLTRRWVQMELTFVGEAARST